MGPCRLTSFHGTVFGVGGVGCGVVGVDIALYDLLYNSYVINCVNNKSALEFILAIKKLSFS